MKQRASFALAALAALGCGPELDRISEIDSLRIVAVQKDQPYAAPAADVQFRMLWQGRRGQTARVERLWVGGCVNPEADSYAACGPRIAANAAELGQAEFEARYVRRVDPGPTDTASSSTLADQVQFRMPDAEEAFARPPPSDPELPRYGLFYVFFAVCAGDLSLAPLHAEFPFECRGADGAGLGPDDFVAGYSAAYIYEGSNLRNANPIIRGLEINGRQLVTNSACQGAGCPACIGVGCFSAQPEVEEPCPDCAFIRACPDDGDDQSCPGVALRPTIDDATNNERDTIAELTQHRSVKERMWINYHVDAGAVRSDVRLLRDPYAGWNWDHGTALFAPKQTGMMHVWAVVRDNRGGVEWVRGRIVVQ